MSPKVSSESLVSEIKRKTRRKYSSEEKIRIVLEGLRGEESISAICRREGISSNLYCDLPPLLSMHLSVRSQSRSHGIKT